MDGRGASQAELGFTKPKTFPDFSECSQTTREANVDWKAQIRDGGPARGFSPIMPAFGDALSERQIDSVISYLRGFCREKSWPREELNLPRPLVTEKAFPEDEVVSTATVNTSGAVDATDEVEYERRLGARYEMEFSLPLGVEPYNTDVLNQLAKQTGLQLTYGGRKGLGDAGFGIKRVILSSLRSGSILAIHGAVALPLGPATPRLGAGMTAFEASLDYGQRLPKSIFLQFQGGTDQPVHTEIAPADLFWRTAIGWSHRQDNGVGRIWSPMVEFLGIRDVAKEAPVLWDVMPEVQVSLSRRQHIRASFGIRFPASYTVGRSAELACSLLWDWSEGGFREGWK